MNLPSIKKVGQQLTLLKKDAKKYNIDDIQNFGELLQIPKYKSYFFVENRYYKNETNQFKDHSVLVFKEKKTKPNVFERLISNSSYPVYNFIDDDGEKIKKPLHLIMALLIPNDDPKKNIINHIDGDKSNCQRTNLEWTTFSKNVQHAHDTGLNTTSRPINFYDSSGKFISSYPSAAKASRELKLDNSSISNCCNGTRGRKCIQYNDQLHIFKFRDGDYNNDDDLSELDLIYYFPIILAQYDKKTGKLLDYFATINDASKKTGINRNTISNYMNGKTSKSTKFIWEKIKPGTFPLDNIKGINKIEIEQKIDIISNIHEDCEDNTTNDKFKNKIDAKTQLEENQIKKTILIKEFNKFSYDKLKQLLNENDFDNLSDIEDIEIYNKPLPSLPSLFNT